MASRITPKALHELLASGTPHAVLQPYDKGRAAMEAFLRWEEALDTDGGSPVDLLGGAPRADA